MTATRSRLIGQRRRWWRWPVAIVGLVVAIIGGLPAAAIASTAAPPAGTVPATKGPAGGDPVSWGTRPADNDNGTGRGHFDYVLSPGEHLRDALVVSNNGTAPVTLAVYASDAYTTESGSIDLLPADQQPVDAGNWVRIRRERVTVAPGSSAEIGFTVRVPPDATPGDHPGGLVTSLITEDTGTAVTVDRRLGSRLYVRVPGNLRPAVQVSDVHVDYRGSVNPFAAGTAIVEYRLTNTGNTRLTPQETVGVDGLFGVVHTDDAKLPPMPDLLPGSTITRAAHVNGVWPLTRMSAAVSVHPTPTAEVPGLLGTASVAGAGIWVLPWPQATVLVLLSGVLLAVRRVRRRQRVGTARSRSTDAAGGRA